MFAPRSATPRVTTLCSTVAMLVLLLPQAFADEKITPQQLEFFEGRIRPVLVQHCYKCHAAGEKDPKGGLLLDSRDGIRRGGESGHAVVPSNLKESLLISAIRHDDLEMPPKSKLPENVIADFEKWIRMGAPDPRSGSAATASTEIDIEEGRRLWAFQQPRSVAAPKVRDRSWPLDDVDRFILSRLEAEGLAPVAAADNGTLLRRIYFDLIGLPPSPDDIAAFQKAAGRDRQAAIANLVDRLLDSPQFGERWGRHWLDVARYAESNGNVRNVLFPHAWRYRDYVIDALNRDTPFNEFITQQVAGDLLTAETPDQRNRNRIATGFLALASRPVSKGNPEYAMDLVADQIEVTSRGFMALTVFCARCHDHKFDPIPTADYYALAGIFTSTEVLHGGAGQNGMAAAAAHQLEGIDKDGKPIAAGQTKDVATAAAEAEDGKKKQQEAARKGQAELAALLQETKKVKQEFKLISQTKGKRDAKLSDKEKLERTERERELRERLATLGKQRKALQSKVGKRKRGKRGDTGTAKNLAIGVRDKTKVADCRIHVRGEASRQTDSVPRGFLTVASYGQIPAVPDQQSGRLEYAQWLTSRDNPLTARVVANRIWHHLFGAGIVRTVDNFGLNGERPSHPELLDHLALRFMDDGWSIKRMIRTIVLTRSYQLSSRTHPSHLEQDPENRLIWRHDARRLDGEAIRDAMLLVSGQLDVSPPRGSMVSRYGNGIIRDGLTTDTFQVPNSHRSVYLPVIRNGVPEMLGVFDFADPSLVMGRRNVTTVPAQSLYLMNSPFVVEQAEQFADRLLADPERTNDDRIRQAYRLALSREPTAKESQRSETYLKEMSQVLSSDGVETAGVAPAAWASFCQALLASSEFRHVD